ncbi:MAG: hypothetical protein J4G12_10270, partial [Gemmatimonadetes bacterium]|nr:hypothetical protein [Gemmatimonadota bacterium]
MNALDRDGLFKARLLSWSVYEAESGAVAVSCELHILEEWNGADWEDWSGYEDYRVFGNWWVIKRNGTVNASAVAQLRNSLGWDGSLDSVMGPPPGRTVQVVVRGEEYNGRVQHKASWMQPGDHKPNRGVDTDRVGQLQARFGSLLRAAASSGAAPAATATAAVAPAKPDPDDDLPF